MQILRAAWHRLTMINARIENCWVGDLLGVGALFATLFSTLIMIGVLQ